MKHTLSKVGLVSLLSLAFGVAGPAGPAVADQQKRLKASGTHEYHSGGSSHGSESSTYLGTLHGTLGKAPYEHTFNRWCYYDDPTDPPSEYDCYDEVVILIQSKQGDLTLRSGEVAVASYDSPFVQQFSVEVVSASGKYDGATGAAVAVVDSETLSIDGTINMPKKNA